MAVRLDVEKLKPPTGGAIRTPWYDHLSDHPSNGLTPSKLQALLRRAELGDLTAQAELFEDIADKDPSLVAVFDNRKHGVLSKSWEIIPIEGSGKAGEKQAKARREMLENLSYQHTVALPGFSGEYLDFESLLSYLMDATARGFSAALPVWDGKTWELVACKQFAQKHFISADVLKSGTEEYNPYELRVRTVGNEANGEEIKPYQFIIHWYRGKSGLPTRVGLMRTLTWWYLFKNYAMKSWVKAAERFGMPLVWGQYEDTATTEEREVLEEAVKGLGLDGGAVTSKSTMLNIIEAKGGNITGEIWKDLMHQCDMEFAKAVLGHSSTTESTPGKLGKEDQALKVQADRVEADARALERTINQQILRPCNLNIEGKDLCYFKIRYEADEDLNSKADRYTKLITAGVKIPSKHVYEVFDIPEPVESDEIVTPASSDPLAAALGGAMGASMKNARRFENARLYANATQSKGQRIARKELAIKETDRLEAEYETKLAEAYAVLVKGLPISDDAPDMLNVDEFRKVFGETVEDMIRGAMRISATEMQDRELLKEIRPNKINPFDIKNMRAIDWLLWQAMTLTQIEGEIISLSLAKRIKDELVNFETSGMSPKDFYSRILDAEGIGKIGKGHLVTVLRTNIATARSAAVEFSVETNPSNYPAWQYVAITDNRTRHDHRALDGKVFAWKDRKFWPPIGFNCRCEGSPIHKTEMEEEGYEIHSGPVSYVDESGAEKTAEVPRGFGTDTRVNYARWVDKMKRENETIRTRIDSLTKEA